MPCPRGDWPQLGCNRGSNPARCLDDSAHAIPGCSKEIIGAGRAAPVWCRQLGGMNRDKQRPRKRSVCRLRLQICIHGIHGNGTRSRTPSEANLMDKRGLGISPGPATAQPESTRHTSSKGRHWSIGIGFIHECLLRRSWWHIPRDGRHSRPGIRGEAQARSTHPGLDVRGPGAGVLYP